MARISFTLHNWLKPPAIVQVHKMLSCWQQLIVVTTSVMPSGLAKALLEAGAKAVVCCRGDTSIDMDPEATNEFMAAFYQHLLSGRPIVKALAHAGKLYLPAVKLLEKDCCHYEDSCSPSELWASGITKLFQVYPSIHQCKQVNSNAPRTYICRISSATVSSGFPLLCTGH